MRTLIALLALSFFILSCSSSEESGQQRPNFVFIMSDDHAYQAISAYDSKINETPSIDRLADEGMLFTRSYVTNSICGPSRAVMLTGKFSHLNGFVHNGNSFDGSQQTFPKLLQKAGYKTAIFGKWHLKSEPTGFDYWSVLPGQGDYYYPNFITMGERAREPGYVTDLITDKAIGWMDSAVSKDEPFAILIHHKGPHRTWMPAIRHLNKYKGVTFEEPATLFDNYETRENTAGAQEMSIKDHLQPNYDLFQQIGMNEPGEWGNNYLNNQAGLMTEEEVRLWEEAYREENEAFAANTPTGDDLIRWNYQRYMRNYLSVVAGVDENIGRVMDYLESTGLDENTVLVYTSDQGFYLGDHGWYDKRWMYEESFRMPLVIKYPGTVKAGSTSDDLVQNLDFAPTFLELAGIEIPSDMQGISMVNSLKGLEADTSRDALYYHYYEYPGVHAVKRHYGVFHNNFKLMHFYHDVDTWEMYDVDNDPNELNNIYDNPEFKSIRESLHKKLEELQVQYGDTADLTPPTITSLRHNGVGSRVQFVTSPSNRYNKGMDSVLTDGLHWNFHPNYSNHRSNYLGFNSDVELVVDLGSVQSLSSIGIHTIQQTDQWIHYPTGVKFLGSRDGKSFSEIGGQEVVAQPENGTRFISQSVSTSARYVKVMISRQSEIPGSLPGAGQPAWLFVDEIVVE